MPNYSKEQLSELYNNLPEDLKKTASSDDTAYNIQEICTENGVTDDDDIFDIAKNIGYVFLGLLPPNELSYVFEKEIDLEKSKAELIASEIIRFVFLPVKTSLETLYKMEIRPTIKPGADITVPRQKTSVLPDLKKNAAKKDTYREPLE